MEKKERKRFFWSKRVQKKNNKKLVEKCYNFWKFVHLLIFDVFGR